MFGQAILSNILDLTRISLYTYFVLSTNIPKSKYQQSIDDFLLYTTCLKSFYVYTLNKRIFSYNFSSINS